VIFADQASQSTIETLAAVVHPASLKVVVDDVSWRMIPKVSSLEVVVIVTEPAHPHSLVINDKLTRTSTSTAAHACLSSNGPSHRRYLQPCSERSVLHASRGASQAGMLRMQNE
jgi:hypothetical protein